MGCFFATNGAFLELFWGQKNLLAFNFLSLFRAYGNLRYIALVSPYHVLLLSIGHSHLLIQAVHLFCKTSAGPLTNVYLKLNQICVSFVSKDLQFCRAYVVHKCQFFIFLQESFRKTVMEHLNEQEKFNFNEVEEHNDKIVYFYLRPMWKKYHPKDHSMQKSTHVFLYVCITIWYIQRQYA